MPRNRVTAKQVSDHRLRGACLGVTLLPEALIGSAWRERRVAIHPLPRGEGRVETVFIRRRDGFTTSALRAFFQCARPALAQPLAAG
jgi:LysR family transcriptional regulator, cell division regulator